MFFESNYLNKHYFVFFTNFPIDSPCHYKYRCLLFVTCFGDKKNSNETLIYLKYIFHIYQLNNT